MKRAASPRAWPVPVRIAGMTCVAAYAYWATGLQPFTVPCYIAVGVPVADGTGTGLTADAPEIP